VRRGCPLGTMTTTPGCPTGVMDCRSFAVNVPRTLRVFFDSAVLTAFWMVLRTGLGFGVARAN